MRFPAEQKAKPVMAIGEESDLAAEIADEDHTEAGDDEP
jgi:hypothetical protein